MATKNLLITDRQKVRDAFGKSGKEIQEDIKILRDWLKEQPHLPEIPNDNIIEAFLINNKLSIERAKPKLDMYYSIRSLLPDFYENTLPSVPRILRVLDQMNYCPLPNPTDELYRVIFVSMKENSEDINLNDAMAHFLNIYEVRFNEDLVLGDVVVLDLANVKMSHIIKVTPVYMKKCVTVLEKVMSNRLKGIHFINSPGFVDMLLGIFKAAFKPKIVKRMHIHSSLDSFYKQIPKKILPKDYGGDELSLDELTELWKQKLSEYQSRFEKLASLKVKDNVRPAPLENHDILGFHGNFKKLDVD